MMTEKTCQELANVKQRNSLDTCKTRDRQPVVCLKELPRSFASIEAQHNHREIQDQE